MVQGRANNGPSGPGTAEKFAPVVRIARVSGSNTKAPALPVSSPIEPLNVAEGTGSPRIGHIWDAAIVTVDHPEPSISLLASR